MIVYIRRKKHILNIYLLNILFYIFASFCFYNSFSSYSFSAPNVKNKTTKDNQKDKQENKLLTTGEKPIDIPEFPKISVEEYKKLFDDNFSNIVDPNFQEGQEWDIFVDQKVSNDINRRYITGNDEIINEMDVIEAEKKTMIDNGAINKENITTHRTRIMAYLTLEQMIFADMFATSPHGYYINAMNKKID